MNNSDLLNICELLGNLHSELPFYETCSPLLIYGAGNIGKDVYAALDSRGIKISGFLDRKAVKEEQWKGMPVYAPDWDGLSLLQKQQAGVIIALHNRDVEIPPIIKALLKRGYGRIITLIEFFDHFSEEMGDRFWLTSRSNYKRWEEDISKGYSIWADEPSQRLYLKLLKFRLTGDYDVLPPLEQDCPYFPTGFLVWDAPLRLVDGGAFDGDTLRSLFSSQYPVEAAAVFEPDPDNLNELIKYLSSVSSYQIYLWPCAIYSSTQQLYFSSNIGEGSHLLSSGNISIQATALDDVLRPFKPNLIKLDIEGAEVDGLMGAKRIIRENRPGLAICTYHRPEHMWQIPSLINSWDLGYKFYMRMHKHNGFELVMYAKAV